jgi:hypothetical protein
MADKPEAHVRYPANGSGKDPEFKVFGVGQRGANLCVDINNAEGGYQAHFVVKAPAGNGPVRVTFDSKPEARALLNKENLSALELGLRVSLLPSSGICSPKSALLPALWREGPISAYQLLVGGGSFGTPALKVDNGPIQDCAPLSQVVGRPDMGAGTYGFSCAFAKPGQTCSSRIQLKVLWFQGARLVDHLNLPIENRC